MRAILAFAKADLISSFKNVSTVFFGILFPLIFILVFGFLGQGSREYEVGLLSESNTENPIYEALDDDVSAINLIKDQSDNELEEQLKKGEIQATLSITQTSDSVSGQPVGYNIKLNTSGADPENSAVVASIVNGLVDKINLSIVGGEQLPLTLETEEVAGREFKQIDFILPGQLGFALLSSGIFGTSFLFVNLRQTYVIKRFFATPAKKHSIILGLGLSKLLFALLQAAVIILVGRFAFGYTLVNGVSTLLVMLFLSMVGLILFLGIGFIISSIAKDENAVPPLANLVTLPQFLLAGTFFPIEVFPEWLQPVSKILPLTYLNDAMRRVAFEGESILNMPREMLFLFISGVVIYAVAIKVFRWEA